MSNKSTRPVTPDSRYIQTLTEAQKKAFKYAVFSGGGAKGAIYSGVHETLYDTGILDGLEGVAGSSAGAMTAALIATGISTEDCKALSENTDFSTLLGKGKGLFKLHKDGNPIYELAHNAITNNIKQYTANVDVQSVCASRIEVITKLRDDIEQGKIHQDYSEDEKQLRMQQLEDELHQIQEIKNNNGTALAELKTRVHSGGKVYFKDLAMLRLLNPSKFKDLIITATNKGTGELKIFNATETPDVEIALACRASAAIPIVLRSTEIDGVKYVDGGYVDNIPQRYFSKNGLKQSEAEAVDVTQSPEAMKKAALDGRVLAMAFGHSIDDSANIAVYSLKQRVVSYGVVLGFIIDTICKMATRIGGKKRYTESEQEVYNELRKNSLNVVVLDTGEVKTLSFQTAKEQAAYLHIKGRIQTMEYLRNHEMVPTEADIHFEQKNFMLGVYEQLLVRTPPAQRKNAALQELLKFCETDKWYSGKSVNEVLTEYIQTAATDLADYRMRTNTKALTALIITLNDKRTPNSVRQTFVDALGLNIGPMAQQHLADIKFKPNDFAPLLTRHKPQHDTSKSHAAEHKVDVEVKRDAMDTARKEAQAVMQGVDMVHHKTKSNDVTSVAPKQERAVERKKANGKNDTKHDKEGKDVKHNQKHKVHEEARAAVQNLDVAVKHTTGKHKHPTPKHKVAIRGQGKHK